jgi:6-phosphogluconolactonase
MNRKLEVDTIPALARIFAERTEAAARRAVTERGRFGIAIPGGSVAHAFLPGLVTAAIEWERVDLFWVDERCVPSEHPDSNYRVAKELLLDRIREPGPRVHRMGADAADVAGAAAAYEGLLATRLGDPPRFDLVLLGVGPDGHVASLFPGHRALSERVRRVLPVDDAPKPPPRRMTLALPALEETRLICIAAFGAEKAAAIRDAFEAGNASPLPVARAARLGERTLFLLDSEAASLLQR